MGKSQGSLNKQDQEWSKSGLKSQLERMSGLVLDRAPRPHTTEDAAVSTAMATGLSTLLSLPVSSRIKAWEWASDWQAPGTCLCPSCHWAGES